MHNQPPRDLRPGGAPDRVATVLQRYQGIPVPREDIAHEAGVQTCKLNGILTSIESHLLVAEEDGRLIYMGRRRGESVVEREIREERERREYIMMERYEMEREAEEETDDARA